MPVPACAEAALAYAEAVPACAEAVRVYAERVRHDAAEAAHADDEAVEAAHADDEAAEAAHADDEAAAEAAADDGDGNTPEEAEAEDCPCQDKHPRRQSRTPTRKSMPQQKAYI